MKIKTNSKWRHSSGRIYTVVLVANEQAAGRSKLRFPITINYTGGNGEVWAKMLLDFLETMTPLDDGSPDGQTIADSGLYGLGGV